MWIASPLSESRGCRRRVNGLCRVPQFDSASEAWQSTLREKTIASTQAIAEDLELLAKSKKNPICHAYFRGSLVTILGCILKVIA